MTKKKLCPLHEASQSCGVSSELIIRFISFEWIKPAERAEEVEEHYLFDEEDIARVRLIFNLQNDFGVNDESIPIILNLIDQLNRYHIEIKK